MSTPLQRTAYMIYVISSNDRRNYANYFNGMADPRGIYMSMMNPRDEMMVTPDCRELRTS